MITPRTMTCTMNLTFWDAMYRNVVLNELDDCIQHIDEPDSGELNSTELYKTYKMSNARILIMIEGIKISEKGNVVVQHKTNPDNRQRTLDSLLGYMEEFKTKGIKRDIINRISSLIIDMQGTESIESANMLWDIQQVYKDGRNGDEEDKIAIEAIDKFVYELLFCACRGFCKKKTTVYPSFTELKENKATFSREAVYRQYETTPALRTPIQASIALVFWKYQIEFGRVITAHSEIQDMQRSNDKIYYRIGERFVRTLAPYGSLCVANQKLYSMRTRTTPEQVKKLKSLLRYDGSTSHAYYEAFSSVLMATSTDNFFCTEHVQRDEYEGRGIPVMIEFDTSLVHNKRYFIYPDELLVTTDSKVQSGLYRPIALLGGEAEILVLPGLLIRYLHMEKMKWGKHEGYKIHAEFVGFPADDLQPEVMTNGHFGGMC